MKVGFISFWRIKTRHNPCRIPLGLSDKEVVSVLIKEGQESLGEFPKPGPHLAFPKPGPHLAEPGCHQGFLGTLSANLCAFCSLYHRRVCWSIASSMHCCFVIRSVLITVSLTFSPLIAHSSPICLCFVGVSTPRPSAYTCPTALHLIRSCRSRWSLSHSGNLYSFSSCPWCQLSLCQRWARCSLNPG